MVSTHLKNIVNSQILIISQVGLKIKQYLKPPTKTSLQISRPQPHLDPFLMGKGHAFHIFQTSTSLAHALGLRGIFITNKTRFGKVEKTMGCSTHLKPSNFFRGWKLTPFPGTPRPTMYKWMALGFQAGPFGGVQKCILHFSESGSWGPVLLMGRTWFWSFGCGWNFP